MVDLMCSTRVGGIKFKTGQKLTLFMIVNEKLSSLKINKKTNAIV